MNVLGHHLFRILLGGDCSPASNAAPEAMEARGYLLHQCKERWVRQADNNLVGCKGAGHKQLEARDMGCGSHFLSLQNTSAGLSWFQVLSMNTFGVQSSLAEVVFSYTQDATQRLSFWWIPTHYRPSKSGRSTKVRSLPLLCWKRISKISWSSQRSEGIRNPS